ncbi:DUF4258 domain-containing protein [Pseudanabaenaceae cyanobacterium LEGE 13415]|nr:DUF4258 domain-containing protein [Pseudanabaenaceae cyanobacterium LEGE 13415]
MDIDEIIDAIQLNRIRITDHAVDEAEEDDLTLDEIFQSVYSGEIIEQYHYEKSDPRCLIFGLSDCQEPIHSIWEYNKASDWAVLITVYRPDPARWLNWRNRI